jgi:hypothetical protein
MYQLVFGKRSRKEVDKYGRLRPTLQATTTGWNRRWKVKRKKQTEKEEEEGTGCISVVDGIPI